MSKAFTKESDGADDESAEVEVKSPAGVKNYITPQGAARLKEELRSLLYDQRPELVKTISWAASNGDRSENGDYIYGKRRLREIDRRIRFLTKRLESAEIVDSARQASDRVLFGATVKIEDSEGRQRTYQIVGIDETDVGAGRISWISPLAKAVLNSKVGDVVQLQRPGGPGSEEDLEILEIKYT